MKATMRDTVSSVTTTVASSEDAQRLARVVLDQRLAACVQIEPGLSSLYRWEGVLNVDPETRVVFKTMPHCEEALCGLLALQHPYQLPQLLAVRMAASSAYAEWVAAQVVEQPDPGTRDA